MLPRQLEVTLANGELFDLINGDYKRIHAAEICSRLGKLCRWAGAGKGFYSVAEHSIHVANRILIEYNGLDMDVLDALFHDASEAFLGDLASPVKQVLPSYQILEQHVQSSLQAAIGIVPSAQRAFTIEHADKEVAVWERASLIYPYDGDFIVNPLDHSEAGQQMYQYYNNLRGAING